MEKVIVNTKMFGKLETTDRAMDHEYKRFQYMDRKQLFTRLKKVTNAKKLVAMIQTARMFGRRGLEAAAKDRIVELYYA